MFVILGARKLNRVPHSEAGAEHFAAAPRSLTDNLNRERPAALLHNMERGFYAPALPGGVPSHYRVY